MKVAVPTFGERVSPRFDCAVSLLLATVDDGEISERRILDASQWAPHERINHLVDLGVDVVLCGGIDCWSAESLRSVGISLVRSVAGTIDESLDALLRGELRDDVIPVGPQRCGRVAGDQLEGDKSRPERPPGDKRQRGGGRRNRSGRYRGGADPRTT